MDGEFSLFSFIMLGYLVFSISSYIGIKKTIILLCVVPFVLGLIVKIGTYIAIPCFAIAWLLRNK